jgi:hypothetical protein
VKNKGGPRPGSGRPRKDFLDKKGNLTQKILESQDEMIDKLLNAAKGGDLRAVRWCFEFVYGHCLSPEDTSLRESKSALVKAQRELIDKQTKILQQKIEESTKKEELLELIKRKASPEEYRRFLEILSIADEDESTPRTGSAEG